ncbi:Cobalt/zinc/cadmium efflux RND transporter, membrane fusion protein, CzcB family [Labilithrix luteola]|uniref:Cobalt/zinc/cadmium efflux RND transporter, membrane fusion protein, CzcB family n=1 Tax=Labilithrix luteola TaxID=1391654 RepID=A0A0K1PZV3_9BACT|nr:efflux RND transporter periplasmic adaptor subunit [Labilithrix luteola]AKU98679.1 Cobalt/zinc/cadmium efflux RND transporter, membrane fusion protein, CzcB family [Labilithrix luteola]
MGAAAVVLVGTLARSRRGHGASAESSTRDVPRLDGTSVVFSNAFKERAGLAFTKVESVPFKPAVRVVGTVAFNPTYVAAIGTRLRGTVRRTYKYEGDRVTAGEPLAEVESADLAEAQSTAIQAEASLRTAEVQAKREKDLLEKSLTTAREAEVAATDLANQNANYKAAQQRVRAFGGNGTFGTFVMRSPIAGHVIERALSPGQSVDGSIVGYRVADLDHLWIELSVFERDLGLVHLDDDVEVSPLAEPGVKIIGKVAHVGEIIDPTTRSTAVRVTVDHPKYHLRQGQSVHATVTTGTASRHALLVPHASVVHVDGRPTVFVAESDTRVKPTTVKLGGSDGASYEILDGIVAGQRVANAGVFALKSELFR